MFLRFTYLLIWVALWDKAWTEAMKARYVLFKSGRQIEKASRLAGRAQSLARMADASLRKRDEVLALSAANERDSEVRRNIAYDWRDRARYVKAKHLS